MIVSCTSCQGSFDRGITNLNSVCPSCGTDIDRACWYAKNEGTGAISGPFSKAVALGLADQGDCMVFNEKIFEPQFGISEEVEGLLGKIREILLSSSEQGLPADTVSFETGVVGLLREARDTIILLSRKKSGSELFSKDIESALSFLRDDIIGREACQQAIDTLILFSRENPKFVMSDEVVSDCETSIGALVSELNALQESMEITRTGEDDAIGELMERAIVALLLFSRKKPSLEEVAKDRLIRDLKECDCCKALCHRAVQAIQAV